MCVYVCVCVCMCVYVCVCVCVCVVRQKIQSNATFVANCFSEKIFCPVFESGHVSQSTKSLKIVFIVFYALRMPFFQVGVFENSVSTFRNLMFKTFVDRHQFLHKDIL